MLFAIWTRVGQRNHVLDGVEIPHANWGNFERGMAAHCFAVSCAKTTVPIDMQFGMLSWVDPVNRVLYVGAHWRDLVNTTEPSMCCGDAALCQITLTTCLLWSYDTQNSLGISIVETWACRVDWLRAHFFSKSQSLRQSFSDLFAHLFPTVYHHSPVWLIRATQWTIVI